MEEINFFSKNQPGFLKGKNTTTAIAQPVKEILK